MITKEYIVFLDRATLLAELRPPDFEHVWVEHPACPPEDAADFLWRASIAITNKAPITRELLEGKAKSDAILLHSLPRMDEIPLDVDITKWSRYWQEAYHGVVMRMALLALVLGATE